MTAHFVPVNEETTPGDSSESDAQQQQQSSNRHKVTLLIKLSPEVLERERMLSAASDTV